jgi:hypothetical protein
VYGKKSLPKKFRDILVDDKHNNSYRFVP